MEHYVLCVWNGTFAEEDNILITKYLNTLFPTHRQHQYTFDFASDVAAVLKPSSKYITILNTTKEHENLEWKNFGENFDVKDFISVNGNCSESEGLVSKDAVEQLSTSLHTLADLLPSFGTYKLDVLIGSNVLKNLSVSKEPLLSNAFFRFAAWHSAYFSIFLQKGYDQDRLDEWCEIINAEIFHSNSKLELGALLWRGALELQTSNNQENIVSQGFELKLDLNENEDKILCHPVNEDNKQAKSEHIVLSSKLQIVDEISFTSIPPHMMTPIAFRLHTGKPSVLNEKSSYFTEYMLSNKEIALIMRLEYAEINEKIKPDRKYSTSRWQRAVSSGCFKGPECFVSTFKSYITFAVTKSKKSKHILAYPLRNTKDINENFFFSIISYKSFGKSSHPYEEQNVDNSENILSKVPFVRASDLHQIICKHSKLNTNIHETGSSQSGVEDVSNSILFWEDIRKSSSFGSSIKTRATDFIFEEIDPSDWPERIQLLRKQMQNEEKKVPDNALLGQNLKLPQQSFSVSSEDISQYFLPSGEAKDSTNVEALKPLNMDIFVTHEYQDVLHMNWPEIMNCIYHDIYYNFNCQTEDKESLGSQMVKLYIQHETASSCNKQQIIQSFSITLPEKNSSPFKEFRSPSCRQTNLQRSNKIDCISFKQNSMKDLLTKKVLFTSKPSHSEITTKEKGEQKVFSDVGNKRKCSDPVRCSPRKKLFVNYSDPVRCSPRKKNPVNYSGPIRCSPRKKIPVNYSGPSRCSPRKKIPPVCNGTVKGSPRNTTHLSFNGSVRCSPRKKNPVNYHNPTGSRSTDTSKNGSSSKTQMPELLRKKIRSAVATALENNGINLNHPFYQPCGSRLFAICQTFLQDLPLKKGKTSEYLQKIADAHVKQVIEFFKD